MFCSLIFSSTVFLIHSLTTLPSVFSTVAEAPPICTHVYLVECYAFWAPATQLNEETKEYILRRKSWKQLLTPLKDMQISCTGVSHTEAPGPTGLFGICNRWGKTIAHPMTQQKSQGTGKIKSQNSPSFYTYSPFHFVQSLIPFYYNKIEISEGFLFRSTFYLICYYLKFLRMIMVAKNSR